MFDKTAFERVNGFPNCYWGWGYEDTELYERCKLAGLEIDRRDGTYDVIQHARTGGIRLRVGAEEAPSLQAQYTKGLYDKRLPVLSSLMPVEGLSSLSYQLLDKRPIEGALPGSFHYRVEVLSRDELRQWLAI